MTTDDRERLAAANLWQCRAIARRMTRFCPWELDEAESVALEALAEAIRDFDPHRDGPGEARVEHFPAFVRVVLARRVAVYLVGPATPKGYRYRNGARRDRTPEVLQFPEGTGDEFACNHEPPVGWALEWEDWVRGLARRLPPRHGEALRLRYLHADAESAAGTMARMRLKEWRVCHLHREAVAMLRDQLRPSPRGA